MPGLTYKLVFMKTAVSGYTDDGNAGFARTGEGFNLYTDGTLGQHISISWSAFGAARWFLSGAPTVPVAFASLPAGFTPTSAPWPGMSGTYNGSAQVWDADGFPMLGPGSDLVIDAGMSALDLNNTVLRYTAVGNGSAASTIGSGEISGDYVIAASWWYSPSLDDWEFGPDPGGDYEPGDPTPVVASITPNHGPTAGATAVAIVGSGFVNPDGTPGVLSVIVDGEFPATSVVVTDQHHLTCVMPAHWRGGVDVVVNLDFAP